MMPDGDTAAHLREQVGGLFFGTRLVPAHPSSASREQQAPKIMSRRRFPLER